MEWVDAPAELIKRPKLEIQDEAADLQLEKPQTSCDPYSNRAGTARTKGSSGNTTRTDLRKLSEWIKMMRELEDRKRQGGEGSGEE